MAAALLNNSSYKGILGDEFDNGAGAAAVVTTPRREYHSNCMATHNSRPTKRDHHFNISSSQHQQQQSTSNTRSNRHQQATWELSADSSADETGSRSKQQQQQAQQSTSSSNLLYPDLRKTRLCPNVISKGSCALKAEECRFAHSHSELRFSFDRFYKVLPCAFFERGKCRNGEYCRFAHGTNDLRRRSALKMDPGSVALPADVFGMGSCCVDSSASTLAADSMSSAAGTECSPIAGGSGAPDFFYLGHGSTDVSTGDSSSTSSPPPSAECLASSAGRHRILPHTPSNQQYSGHGGRSPNDHVAQHQHPVPAPKPPAHAQSGHASPGLAPPTHVPATHASAAHAPAAKAPATQASAAQAPPAPAPATHASLPSTDYPTVSPSTPDIFVQGDEGIEAPSFIYLATNRHTSIGRPQHTWAPAPNQSVGILPTVCAVPQPSWGLALSTSICHPQQLQPQQLLTYIACIDKQRLFDAILSGTETCYTE